MARPVNEVVGHVLCFNRECTEYADVHQSRKAGHYFYLRCPGCGLNQQTKARPQNYIWHKAEWVPGAEVLKPSNIDDNWQFEEVEKIGAPDPVPAQAPAPEKAQVVDDWCPINEPEQEKNSSDKKPGTGQSRGGFVGGLLLLLAMVGAIWTAI